MNSKKLNGKLNLTNDGDLELFFIGTGSAFARSLNQTNFLLVKGDQHIMVDFGTTGVNALRNVAGLDLGDIKCLLPTHSHSDHIGGIEALALWNRYVTNIGDVIKNKGILPPEKKIKIVVTEQYQQLLWDMSLRGGLEHNEQGRDEFVRLGFTDFFWVERPKWKAHTPREVFTATVGGINLEIFRTLHIPDRSLTFDTSFVSYGLYLPDEKVLFSADSKFDPTMFEMYSDAEVIYHDCQNFVGGVQASLEELKSLPQEIKNKMYLTHYSDDFQKWDISDFAGFAEQGVIYSF